MYLRRTKQQKGVQKRGGWIYQKKQVSNLLHNFFFTFEIVFYLLFNIFVIQISRGSSDCSG